MSKVLGFVLIGVVIGAAVNEVINKQKPEFFGDVGKKVKDSLGAVKDAFKEGYDQVATPADVAVDEAPTA